MNNLMYFSGEDSNNISINDPIDECIRINPDLFSKVQNNFEQNVRVFLDTPLLRIRNYRDEQEPSSEKLISKSDASVSVGAMPLTNPFIYISNLLITAEFRKMNSDEFKESYLVPLDCVIKDTKFRSTQLISTYFYPFGDHMNVEGDIQKYFDGWISPSLENLYRDFYGRHCYFGRSSILRPPFYRRSIIMPDIVHLLDNSTFGNFQSPEICFAIGDYKKGTYHLENGFQKLKLAIENYKLNLINQRQLRSQITSPLFSDRDWSSEVLFALILRKYLYDAFICGTDRVFISDHQNFSGFFQYDFINEEQLIINYYIINDPETVAHGITLRSAMAGFFYKDMEDAQDTKKKLAQYLEVATKSNGSDPFMNVVPRTSQKHSSNYTPSLPNIEDKYEVNEEDFIEGNTICRVIYDTPKCYPSLGLKLPSKVFVKLYHYSSRSWEMHSLMFYNIPDKHDYYNIFFNELLINEKISNSQYAFNFPKLFASGYWNGLPDHPMHIFEYLGKELPIEEWDNDKVYKIIKSRIKELHSIGVTHNDIRIPNIHVSVSGKVSLIDFGLSDLDNNEKGKKKDFESLDEIFEKGKYSKENKNKNEDKNGNHIDRNKENDNVIPNIYGGNLKILK